MKLVVGCPVQDRAWILGRWFDHVETAIEKASVFDDVSYVFVGDPIHDNATIRAAGQAAASYGRSCEVELFIDDITSYERHWDIARYDEMVELRNILLAVVRGYEPDVFWSLDSDILVAPETLNLAMEGLEDFDAVGTKLYMTVVGTASPSYGMLSGPSGALMRHDQEGLFAVDVIMASKLLKPKAYAVDYALDFMGEDIGWSKAARKVGVKLGWDGRIASKHVMERAQLDIVDERCGF